MAGRCEVSAKVTINLKNFESMSLSVGFSEDYSGDNPEERLNKYYSLLEDVQVKLLEHAEETKKTISAIKNP